jgi:D-alanine-D-alanine ligase
MLTTDVPDVEEPPGGPSRRVAVLYNNDFERADDSPSRADQEACQDVVEVAAHVGAALATAGFEPVLVPVASSLDDLVLRLRDMGAAAVFNLVESLGGDATREPEVPALLASASIPFTGNRAATLLSAQDKHITRRLLSAWRVPIAAGVTVTDPDCVPSLQRAGLSFPVFIKPARQDASVGIDQGSIAYDMPQLCARLTHLAATVPGPWLVEDYLPGREFNVAFFPSPHGQPCLSEVDFSGLGAGLAPIVTYNCKWVPGTPDYDVCSHSLPPDDPRRPSSARSRPPPAQRCWLWGRRATAAWTCAWTPAGCRGSSTSTPTPTSTLKLASRCRLASRASRIPM